jgi:hypothetical protein
LRHHPGVAPGGQPYPFDDAARCPPHHRQRQHRGRQRRRRRRHLRVGSGSRGLRQFHRQQYAAEQRTARRDDALSGNVITGNYISANAKDTDDAATSGPTGINLFGVSAATSNIITGNTIQNESIDISVNTPADVEIHLNNLLGSTSIGVQNLGVGTVSATQNYWGCATGANTGKCSTASGGVTYAPFYAASFNIP